jgi:hypothetical protein
MSHKNSVTVKNIPTSLKERRFISFCFASAMADNEQQPPQTTEDGQAKSKNQLKNEEKKREKLAKLAAKQAKVQSAY